MLAPLPALLEARGDALVGRALRRRADRAGDGDAVGELLLGADLSQPFVVARGEALARGDAGAGVADVELCGLLGLVTARGAAAGAGHGHRALLGDVIAVLQRDRILLRQ